MGGLTNILFVTGDADDLCKNLDAISENKHILIKI